MEIFSQHFTTKIENIRKAFPVVDDEPIALLSKLIERPNSELDLESVEVDEIYRIINEMPSTNACGYDGISSRIVKMIPHITSLWLTHGINMMIRKEVFPKVLKISRITPIMKPKKNPMMAESYRPISNLQTFEKVAEEVLKKRIVDYLETNNIIREEHHGGRKNHSTATAKAVLEDAAAKNLDQNKLGILISTNLTSAFDTVDKKILIEKMKYYGMKGKIINLMKSYLEERHEYV